MKVFQKSISGRARLDSLVLVVLFIVAFVYLSSVDAFENLIEFVEIHEDWQLDELMVSVALIGLCGFVFSVRRYLDASRELDRRKVAEANVSWLAHYDPLTELPNRRMLHEFVRNFDHSEAFKSKDISYAIYSIDLDGFKKVNDLHGHNVGDQLLKVISQRLTSIFPNDLVVRLGGDEFVVVAKLHRGTDPNRVADELLRKLVESMEIDDAHAEVGASIGFVLYPSQVETLEDGIRCSDIAMYDAKKTVSTQIVFFREELRNQANAKARLELQLKAALAADAITPHYQPLVNLESGEIYGFEVLARWNLPNGEEVTPSTFIPLAEDAGLISDLSEKLLRKACHDAMNWPKHILLSFNLSPAQLSDRLIGLRIVSILNETGLAPTRLEVEITESAMIGDTETAIFVLEGMQAVGIRVALDDFGTGYSSLSHMSKFNFNRLKIDQSFIHDFEHNDKQRNIVKAIVALGNGMNVATTAEGIEEPSQLAALKLLGCNSGQGFLLGRPMTAERTIDALAKNCALKDRDRAQG